MAGRVEVARDPKARALRAANKRLAQELGILKKALVIFNQPAPCAPAATSTSVGTNTPCSGFVTCWA